MKFVIKADHLQIIITIYILLFNNFHKIYHTSYNVTKTLIYTKVVFNVTMLLFQIQMCIKNIRFWKKKNTCINRNMIYKLIFKHICIRSRWAKLYNRQVTNKFLLWWCQITASSWQCVVYQYKKGSVWFSYISSCKRSTISGTKRTIFYVPQSTTPIRTYLSKNKSPFSFSLVQSFSFFVRRNTFISNGT